MTPLDSAHAKLDNLEGDLFSCTDGESLTHDDPYEAIYDYCFNYGSPHPGQSVEESIRQDFEGGITVDGYKTKNMSPEFLDMAKTRVLEVLCEHLSDYYAWEGDAEDFKVSDFYERVLAGAIKNVYENCSFSPCDQVSTEHLTVDELIATLKEYCPEEFE